MKELEEFMSQLFQERENLKDFLQKQCDIDIAAIEENRKMELFREKVSVKSLKELRVAAIMDRFTLDSYSPECNLMEVTAENWRAELEEFKPHLMFVESAWEGKEKSWYRKVSKVSKEYCELMEYCREQEIPVVFWNKEDPVWTDTFMEAASWADYIFTTDIDCIKRYKTQLNNDRVFLLHFAAQPEIHNPIEKYVRKDKFCFAGAYYHRYPERAKTFDDFAKVFADSKGFEIYDRNYGNSRPEHAFPAEYDSMILGKLDPKEIDKAYKGYHYGVNMNSVNQSQTMFARRVFEMLASNTVTVGNYACGLRNLFGDLTICTNSGKTMKQYLNKYCGNDADYRKYRLAGLRKVLQYHLYEDRLDYIVQKVYGVSWKARLPKVTVYTCVQEETDARRIRRMFDAQTYQNKELIIVASQDFKGNAPLENMITWEEALGRNISDKDGYTAYWNTEDYYGKNYLLDLLLTLRYWKADVIGKNCFYDGSNNSLKLKKGVRYNLCDELDVRCAVCDSHLLEKWNITDLFDKEKYDFENQFSIDEFNYCRKSNEESVVEVDDITIEDEGIDFQKLVCFAEKIKKAEQKTGVKRFGVMELLNNKSPNNKDAIVFEVFQNKLNVNSSMQEDMHEYIYFPVLCDVEEEWAQKEIGFKMICNGDLDMTAVCILLDQDKKRVDAVTGMSGRVLKLNLSSEVKYLKFGIRPRGNGRAKVDYIIVGDINKFNPEQDLLFQNDVAVLTNHYPSDEELYRNMFVHKRALKYKEAGMVCDILRVNRYAKKQRREFQGMNVMEGSSEILKAALESGQLKTICIHFLDYDMWNVLKDYLANLKVIIWSHGADIQPWYRRSFLYETTEEVEKAKKETEIRGELWSEVFQASETNNIHFVFVSEYLAKTAMEDYGYQLKEDKYTVIHNYIDDKMFAYVPKEEKQRKRIISIRPYASSYYANDIMAKAIIELSSRVFFDDLEFLVIGDGELYDEITKPLQKYKNVILRKTFLRQEEIAKLYKEYGIVLIPSRGDTQGVSRDEAMVAGLVPIASRVMAIPEFVDENCGFLADYEDYKAMADAIETLYYHPEQFMEMSQKAHEQVCKLSSFEQTIVREMTLIRGES